MQKGFAFMLGHHRNTSFKILSFAACSVHVVPTYPASLRFRCHLESKLLLESEHRI